MQNKKMTLRFDLDRPEDKRAWEYLQSLNGASMNRNVLTIINQTEQADRNRLNLGHIFTIIQHRIKILLFFIGHK